MKTVHSLLGGVVFALLASGSSPVQADRAPLVDAPPAWWDDDSRHVEVPPTERDPNLTKDMLHATVMRPVGRNAPPARLARRVGSWFGGTLHEEAVNPNALDEVPNSSWFTNRIGLFPVSAEQCARGVGDGDGPSRRAPWVVVSAKTEGVTPGFNVRDANGDVYVIKFDAAGHSGIATGPGAIVGRIFHAAGYHVPQDDVVFFRREDVKLGDGVNLKDATGKKRTMTVADLEAILASVDEVEPGVYRAIASKFLSGRPIGPFDYRGTRDDDPNDRIGHHRRRELRGLRVFAAWLSHFDTKQHNSLDMFVEEDGRSFVRHYLIDFASTLGAGARGGSPKYSHEYGFDLWASLGRIASLGLVEDPWRRLERPEGISEVAYFYADGWDPTDFESLQPNAAFARMTDRDGYWAAKIISAFEDEHLEAICRMARYANPKAEALVAEVLKRRRDRIAQEWFGRVAPIDFFRVEGGRLVGDDLGVERGVWPAASTRYRVRTGSADANRNGPARGEWRVVDAPRVDLAGAGSGEFLAFEFQADRGDGWGPSVTAWVAPASGRVVAVDR